MKYLDVLATLPRLLTAESATDYVCGKTMLADLCSNHGLKPIEQKHRLVVYDRYDIDAAIERKKGKAQ